MRTKYILFLMSALLVGGGLSAEARSSLSAARDLMQEAKSFMVQGKRQQAIERLTQAMDLVRTKQAKKEIDKKKRLYAEQFLTSDSFQKYQEAKASGELERWDECLNYLSGIPQGDHDNLMVLRLKAECQYRSKQYALAKRSLQAVLTVATDDVKTWLMVAEIALLQKQFGEAREVLENIQPVTSATIERHAILKAKVLEQNGDLQGAIEVLKRDHESNLDHVQVLYELGMLYSKVPENAWYARKMLSLFVSRCKRMKPAELEAGGFNLLLPEAQAALTEIDRKLGV